MATTYTDMNRDRDVPRPGVFTDRDRHAADWARAGDEHIFPDEIVGKRSMDGVAERVETGKNV